MNISVLILAAGKGERMWPITSYMPKCLIPVLSKPVIEFWLDKVRSLGNFPIFINAHWKFKVLDDYIKNYEKRNLAKLRVIHEKKLLGSGGTLVKISKDFAKDSFVIFIYADNYSSVDLRNMLSFAKSRDKSVYLTFETNTPSECGVFMHNEGEISAFVEKPSISGSSTAWAGVAILKMEDVRRRLDTLDDLSLPVDFGRDILPSIASNGLMYPVEKYHIDIGTPTGYRRALEVAIMESDNE